MDHATLPAGLKAMMCLDHPDMADAIRHHFNRMSCVTLSEALPERNGGGSVEVLQ